MQNPEKPVFDQFSGSYESVHNDALPAGITREQFFVQKLEWVREQIGSATSFTFLDFGCNKGELSNALAQVYPTAEIYGIDESEASLVEAKSQSQNLAKKPSYFRQIDQLDGSIRFDLISVFNVLHHIDPAHRDEVLQKLRSRLKPKGKLLIWEHNRWNPVTRYLVKICPFDEGVILVGARAMKAKIKELGLNLDEFSYVNITPPKLHQNAFFGFFEKSFKQVPLGTQYRLVGVAG